MRHYFTETEVRWLQENHATGTYEELAVRFGQTFGCEVGLHSIKNKCRKLRLVGEHHPFTAEQDAWLAENSENYANYEEVAEAFNAFFHTTKTSRGIQSHCAKVLRLISGRQAFKKGMQTWNSHPIGHEYVNQDGYTYVKVSDTGIKNLDFAAKHRLMWEKYHGCSVPDGHMIVFLNSDRSDFSEENLYCIPRNIGRMMNSNGWITNSREHTLTAIKWCELYFALRN